VEIRLSGPGPDLSAVPGVSGLTATEGRIELSLDGEVGPFLAAIAGAPIVDLTIEPARLEDAFLEYYADAEPVTEAVP
jgi:ABC-2 type transport system ATP-binding protein